MKTTRAMLVIGVLMLVLAVVVAQGLRPDEAPTVSGPVISGAVSRAPETAPSSAPFPSALQQGGVLVPLDAGTLKMDSTTPASQLAPVSPAPDVKGAGGQKADAGAPATAGTSTASSSGVAGAGASGGASSAHASGQQAGQASGQTLGQAPSEAAAAPKKPEPSKTASANTSSKITKQVVTTAAPQKVAPGQKVISRTRLEIGQNVVSFRLTGVSALQGKAFVLKEPDRVVVDLNGPWAINLGKTPANAMVKSVRAGSQEANTRLVFDMARPAKSFRLVQVAPKTLELQIR